MPRIDTPQQLLEVLGTVFASSDPIAALSECGFELCDELKKRIGEGASRRPSEEEIRRALSSAVGLNRVVFQPGPLTFAGGTGDGESAYDMVFAVQMSLFNDVLAGLFQTHTVPHAVTLADEISASQLSLLETLLRGIFEEFPDNPAVSLGQFRITAPPTVSPVQGTEHVLLHVPFSIGLERPGLFFFDAPPQEVSSIDGSMSFGMRVANEVEPEGFTLGLGSIGEILPLGAPERLNIEISTSSPLQPSSASKLDGLELLLAGAIQDLIESIAQTWTICPRFNVPLANFLVDGDSPGFQLAIQGVDVRAVDSSGGYLGVGLLIGSESPPGEVNLSNQAGLEDPSFTFNGANLHACLAEKLLRRVVRSAFESGDLEEAARAEKSNIRIKDADIDFQPGRIDFRIKGTAVDECPLNVNLDFDGIIALKLDGVTDGELSYKVDNTIGLGDADTLDVILCFVAGALQLFIPVLNFKLTLKIGQFLWGKIFDSESPFDTVSVIFNPRELIPGTELMPSIEVTEATINTTQLRVSANIELQPDTFNTHVYTAFEIQHASPPFAREPVVGAIVQLKDQDVPPPSGDDAVVIESSTQFVGGKILKNVDVVFEPAVADDLLATTTTDSLGRANFVLSPNDIRTTSGTVVTTTITTRLDLGTTLFSKTTKANIESQPDVYFRLVFPNGNTFDTRSQELGMVLNLSSKRLGSPDEPLRFLFKEAPVLAPPGGSGGNGSRPRSPSRPRISPRIGPVVVDDGCDP